MISFLTKKVSEKAGLPPGTLIHVGEQKLEKVRIRLVNYTDKVIEERELESIEECFAYKEKQGITWINIDGLHDVEIINRAGNLFGIHPLVLEDILNTEQRTKLDDMDDYLFIVAKMFYFDSDDYRVRYEQISFIMLNNLILSFQEDIGDIFDPLRERLRKDRGRVRKMGADFLMYMLLDSLVDSYYSVLEGIGEKVESVEEILLGYPQHDTLQAIHNVKRDLVTLRRSIWPLREIIGSLEKGESDLINEKTTIFFRDIYDHTILVIENIEICRDLVSGMTEMFLSSVSNKMNEVMKMLTVIATIFIPLTFIAGVYGMNFDNIPELHWQWGYPAILLLMLLVGLLMLIWFRRKKIL
ncbi:MAG: magnesium/cobalt transporter CorA [Deltaproteobacteria bacterium]|nr:magnesium/cobalt transporter CorA [Deltaproteobacteria bacterium]